MTSEVQGDRLYTFNRVPIQFTRQSSSSDQRLDYLYNASVVRIYPKNQLEFGFFFVVCN